MKCAGHVLEGDVLSGCGDEAVGTTRVHGIKARQGERYEVALCEDHLAAVMARTAQTMTVTLKGG